MYKNSKRVRERKTRSKLISNNTFQVAYTINGADDSGQTTADMVVSISLSAGQQIWMSPSSVGEIWGGGTNGMYTWFSGHLVHVL